MEPASSQSDAHSGSSAVFGLLQRKNSLLLRRWHAIKDVQTLRRIYEDALDEHAEARAREDRLAAVARDSAREATRLQSELATAQDLIGLQEAQLQVLADRLRNQALPEEPARSELVAEIATLEEEIEAAEGECARIEAAISARAAERQHMEVALRDVTDDTRALATELERRRGMQAALQAIEDERHSLAARLAAKTAKCEERRAHVEHVEGQLAAARAAAEELAAQSEALDARASEVAANHAAEFAAVAALHQALIKAANQRARLEDEWANESAARENAEQLFLADQARLAALLDADDSGWSLRGWGWGWFCQW